MKYLLILTALIMFTAVNSFATDSMSKKSNNDISCEDFLEVEPVYQPTIVAWFEGYDAAGDPEYMITEDWYRKPIDWYVTYCTNNKTSKLSEAVKNKAKEQKKS